MSSIALHYQKFGDSGRPLLFIHGLFGSAANWRSVAREFADEHVVYVLDLRNHGSSPHHPSMSYVDMARDVENFILEQRLSGAVVCGHSMGGKATMTAALTGSYELTQAVSGLVVLDIAPVVYKHTHADHLAALAAINLDSLTSRNAADEQLQSSIPDVATRLFLLQSLERNDNQFRWKINIPVLREYMADIVGFPVPELAGKQSLLPALFLYGQRSDYVTPAMQATITDYFPHATLASIDAGHLLHIEQRADTIAAVRRFVSTL